MSYKLLELNEKLLKEAKMVVNGELPLDTEFGDTIDDYKFSIKIHERSIEKLKALLGKKKRKAKPLKPTDKAPEDNIRFVTFDIETENWINMLCFGFYDIQNDFYGYHENLDEALDSLFEYCSRNKIKEVFAHNGGKYDIMFILEAMMSPIHKNNYELDSAIPTGSRLLLVKIRSNKHNFTINFRDNLAFIPMSLEQAGKAYQVETAKETMDFAYIGYAFRNENYVSKLFDDVYIDGKGVAQKKNIVFFNGKELTDHKDLIKKNRGNNLVKTDKIEYFCNSTKKKFRIFNKADVLHYLKVDCICLAQVITKHFKSEIIADAGIAYTVAGQAVKVFQRYLEHEIRPSTDIEDEFVRKSYMGGRTEVFKFLFNGDYDCKNNPDGLIPETLEVVKKQQGKKIYCYDANSLYPTVMEKYDYPLRYIGIKSGNENYKKYEYGVWKVKVHVPEDLIIPPLGIQHTFENGSSKFIFGVGVFEGYWTKHELEYAKTLGVKVLKYYQGAVYDNAKPIFRKFITEMYSRRLVAKKSGDTTTSEICKLMMNSCYGKLGMSKENKEFFTKDMGIYGQTEVRLQSGSGGILRMTKMPSDTSAMFSKVILATYVTSYARVYMHKKMMEVGADKIYYTDTDSIFTTEKMIEGDNLGEMKLEYEAVSSCFLAPKSYTIQGIIDRAYEHKIVLKGYDKFKREHINPRELFDYHLGSQSEIKAFDPEKFMSFGSAFAHNVALGMIRSEESETIIINRALFRLEADLERALIKGNKKLITSIKNKIKTKKERLETLSELKFKKLKVKYDKRIQDTNKIDTTPIILNG